MSQTRQTEIFEQARDKSGSFGMLEQEHLMAHRGKSYSAEFIVEGLADKASRAILIEANDANVHLHIEMNTTGKINVKTYEDSTFSEAGTTADGETLTQFNRVVGGDTGDAVVSFDPTLDDIGDLRAVYIVPGGTGGQAIGGSSGSDVETIIPAGKQYYIVMTNDSGQSRDIDFGMHWYEV